MKKTRLLAILFIFLLMFLISCNNVIDEFLVKDSFIYYIGDDYPEYQEGLIVVFNNDDLSESVIIDDSHVNYDKEGTYTLIYILEYQDEVYKKYSNVEVLIKEDIYYNVYFESNLSVALRSVKILENNLVTMPTLTAEGKRLIGWYIDNEFTTKWDFNNDLVNEDIVLYAKWENLNTYNVSFETNGEDYISDLLLYEGSLIEDNYNLEREGYYFLGWYVDNDYHTLWDFQYDLVNEDLVLYAKWEEITKYLVSFETNMDILLDDIYVYENTLIEDIYQLESDGFSFSGWYLDSDFNNIWDFSNDIVKKDITLYARWVENELSFNFYYINDTHGAVLENYPHLGLAKIGNLIKDEKTNNPETTIFITGGDMLQGQYISNYYYGSNIIEILNDLSLDAFVIGNHEFDWGLDKVTQYFNGEHEVQANFPFLGANVIDLSTNEIAEDLKTYTIITKSNVKIAIIGTIGKGLESSIASERVSNYEFIDPIIETKYWSEVARSEGADIVVAATHGADEDNFNDAVRNFTGNSKVDIIFNGHSHRQYIYPSNRGGTLFHIMQTGSSGETVGRITLTYDPNDKKVINSQAKLLTASNENRLKSENPSIASKIDLYYDEVAWAYETITYSEGSYNQAKLTEYIAKLMQVYTDSDIGIHNTGGTRAPISYGEALNYSKLLQISPFDNKVITVLVSGRTIKNVAKGKVSYYIKSGLNVNSLNDDQLYKLATNDYIFGNNNYLKYGQNVDITNILVLDMFYNAVLSLAESHGYWTTELPINPNNVNLTTYMYVSFENKRYYF